MTPELHFARLLVDAKWKRFFLLLATTAQLHLDVAQSAVRYNGMPHTHKHIQAEEEKKLSCSTCRLIEKRMSLVNRFVAMNCFPFRFDYLHSASLPFSICSPLFLLLISHLASEGSPPPPSPAQCVIKNAKFALLQSSGPFVKMGKDGRNEIEEGREKNRKQVSAPSDPTWQA